MLPIQHNWFARPNYTQISLFISRYFCAQSVNARLSVSDLQKSDSQMEISWGAIKRLPQLYWFSIFRHDPAPPQKHLYANEDAIDALNLGPNWVPLPSHLDMQRIQICKSRYRYDIHSDNSSGIWNTRKMGKGGILRQRQIKQTATTKEKPLK